MRIRAFSLFDINQVAFVQWFRTPGFHSGNAGSNPARDTRSNKSAATIGRRRNP